MPAENLGCLVSHLLGSFKVFNTLEFKGPTGPLILAPAEGSMWRTQGLTSLAGHITYSKLRVLFDIKNTK